MSIRCPRDVLSLAMTAGLVLAGCSQANTTAPVVDASAPVAEDGSTPPVSAAVPVPEGAVSASAQNAAGSDAIATAPLPDKATTVAAAPALGPDGKPVKPEPPPFAAADYAGKWKITDGKTGNTCAVTLDKTELKGNLRASHAGCKTVDLTHISGWQVRGRAIVLVSGTGERILEMQAASENRFDGGLGPGGPNITMWR